MTLGIIVGTAVIGLMACLYAEFRVKEDRLRQGEALDRGDRD